MDRSTPVDLGLRYEYVQWPVDKFNHLSDFNMEMATYVWAGRNPVTGQGPNTRRNIIDPRFDDFAPRVGLAYQVTPNNILRGGFGTFFDGDYYWMTQGIRGEWPYGLSENAHGTNNILPTQPMSNYWPPYTTTYPGVPPSASWTENKREKTGVIQQWNVGVQHEFTQNLLLEVNYIGNHSVHLPMFYAANTPAPGPGTIGTSDHPYPDPIVGILNGLGNYSSADYNGLQAKVEKRFSSGFQFMGSYSWGHNMNVGGSSFAASTEPQNPRDWRADWASGDYDLRQIFTLSYIYQLPVGSGKRFLGNANPFAKQVLGGWTVSGITRYTTGPPVNITIPTDNANCGCGGQRPDFIAGQPARIISSSDRTRGWLNPASYQFAPPYTFGNLGRATARAPGLGNWDLGLFKDFDIHEGRQYFQFRAEGFNVFNNVDFGPPASSFTSPGFGDITSVTEPAREIQLALKFVF